MREPFGTSCSVGREPLGMRGPLLVPCNREGAYSATPMISGASRGLASLATCLALAIAPAFAADPQKVLRVAFQGAESGFDPALIQDVYSAMIADNIFDPMLAYDYLARPAKLIANTLDALPEVSSDGMVFTFHVKKGIYFTPDPA